MRIIVLRKTTLNDPRFLRLCFFNWPNLFKVAGINRIEINNVRRAQVMRKERIQKRANLVGWLGLRVGELRGENSSESKCVSFGL